MLITSGELTPLSWGLIGAVGFFSVQLLLCCKAKRKTVKCIPLYLVLLGILCSVLLYFGVFGTSSAGVLPGHELIALLLAFMIGIAATGILAAWLVYGVAFLIKKNGRPS